MYFHIPRVRVRARAGAGGSLADFIIRELTEYSLKTSGVLDLRHSARGGNGSKMAALKEEQCYGLSCGRVSNGSNVSVFHVKLTDSALRAFEGYQSGKVNGCFGYSDILVVLAKSVRAALTGGVWPVPTHSAAAAAGAVCRCWWALLCHARPIGWLIVASLLSLNPRQFPAGPAGQLVHGCRLFGGYFTHLHPGSLLSNSRLSQTLDGEWSLVQLYILLFLCLWLTCFKGFIRRHYRNHHVKV